MKLLPLLKRCAMAAFAGIVAILPACDSVIYDYEEDCVYYVRFEYDYNLKWANAFPSEVKSVTLYVLDEQDNIVYSQYDNSPNLASKDYCMVIDSPNVGPGRYKLVAWGGDEEIGSFPKTDAQKRADLNRRLNRDVDPDGSNHHRTRMDRLYYGSLPSNLNSDLAASDQVKDGYVQFSKGYRDVFTIPMIKDTNNIRIVLQQQSGDLDGRDFDYWIDDQNGHLDSENDICDFTTLSYHPWEVYTGGADWMLDNPDGFVYNFNTAVAEFTTNRLMEANKNSSILTIKNHEGKEVVRLPLIQALLLAKGIYYSSGPGRADANSQFRYLSDQEWLDRQDEYSLVFLLDQGGRWVSTQINILSWKVVIQNTDL